MHLINLYLVFYINLVLLITSFFSLELHSQIAINEIQASPVGDEPEWVEILNISDREIKLEGGWFCDLVSYKKMPDFILNSGQFAILTKDTLTLKSIRKIPLATLLIEFSLPGLNNTWDCLSIRNKDSSLIDSVYYNMSWGKKGISLERLDCMQSAFDSKNWLPSKSIDSATCGYANSVARKNNDLMLKDILYVPNDYIQIEVSNEGKQLSSESICKLCLSNNRIEKQLSFRVPILNPQSNYLFSIKLDSINLSSKYNGINKCRVVCDLDSDEDRSNDTLTKDIYVSYPRKTIQINEFLFESSEFSSDYIEFYNGTEDTISLFNWLIHDKTVSQKADTFRILTKNFIIYPNNYAVISFDSVFFHKFPELIGLENVFVVKSSFNLNADEDEIVIKDPNKITMDSLRYYRKWHLEDLEYTKDISLEKINPNLLSELKESWTSCTSTKGGTPAKENSTMQPIKAKGELSAAPNPFSPFSNNQDKFCLISYKLPFNHAKISSTIYNLSGHKVRELCNLEVSSGQGSLVWDGKNDDGFYLSIGPYILFLEAINVLSGDVFSDKIILVIGK